VDAGAIVAPAVRTTQTVSLATGILRS
jgi:hypothetical protein